MKLKDKIAVVTGGSSGIGQAGAILLAKEGANILLTYRNNYEGAIYTKKKVNELGKECEILKVNFENINGVRIIIKKTIEKYSKIDILVNNAGINRFIDFFDDTIENLNYLMKVNVNSIFTLSQIAAKEMIKRNGGSIINITSISGISVNAPGLASYCTSKAAANMLTKALAKEFGKYNIRVNAILPGVVDTPLLWRGVSKKDVEKMRKETPLKMIGKPEDIAGMILFLASDDSRFMTGSLIIMDGGITL